MSQKSSFYLAIVLIANPFVLLLFQNCSVFPQASAQSKQQENVKSQAPSTTNEIVRYKYTKSF